MVSFRASLDSGPFYSLRYTTIRDTVFTTDREMALYPRITIPEYLGYRKPRGIAISRAIAISGVLRKMTYRDE